MLIGIYSPVPQSGKSTVASYLADHYKFVRRPFAGFLKEMAEPILRAHNIPPGVLYEGDKSQPIYQDKTLRHLLQTLGTEWGRKCMGENFWADMWTAGTAKALRAGHRVVVEDMRFPNEFAAVQALGGWTWKVIRPQGGAPTLGHASEGALEDMLFDTELVNSGTLAELELTVDAALRAGGRVRTP